MKKRKLLSMLLSVVLILGSVPFAALPASAADTYSISYNLNGGAVTGNPTSYDVNTSPVRLNNPTRAGYTFTGWTGSNGSTPSTQVDTPNVLSSGISYSTASPLTANSRDHILGNDFTVLPGMTYRVFVTAKRTAGSLDMQGGIWYTGDSKGDAWEGYPGAFTWLRDAGDGWGVYYKDITVPSGKAQGKFYIQLDQANSGGATTWLISNCYVTAYFEPLDAGLSYTTSNPFTCSNRDHIIGNGLSVTVGQTYRVYVTARRTAGSLALNGGLWYYDGTAGDPWDSVGGAFSLIYDIGNGWGRYYKDVTVPAGKIHGQPYFQIEQSHSGAEGNVWQIADIAVVHTSLSNLSYTANWRIDNYSVSYNLNGGSASGNPTGYNVNTLPVRLNNPTKTGYTFTGWTGSNGASPSTDVTVPNGVSSGLSGYTVSSPYTASARDHIFGNEFPVVSGGVYRVFVTAKRTAGSLPMHGGIAYTGRTAGEWYDGVDGAFTYLSDAGDGWGNYYRNITVPAGKQKGKFYINLDQWDGSYATTWLLANCSVTQLFTPFSLGLDGYTTSNPYVCSSRDHVTGNSFPVEVGRTYTVLVTAKRTAGSLPMQGGIAYSAGQTSGYWYDSVSGAFTYLGDAGNGWGRYYKNVTVPAGKQRGQIYIQMEQWDSSATTTWQVAEMAVLDAKVGNLSYTANWTANKYTVTFNGNGATGGSTAPVNATYDADALLTANGFTKTGYTFAGWATSAQGTAAYGDGASVRNLTAAANGSVELFAKWTANPYTLTVDVNGGDLYAGNINASYIIGDTETIVEPTRTGYHFTGWTVSAGTLTDGVYTFAASDATLTANWEINTYTVTFKDGYTNETLGTDNVEHGSAATAPDAPAYHPIADDNAKHMKFTGWDNAFDNITGELTVTAQYAEEAHDAWSGYTNDGETHSRTCEHCGYVETEAHGYSFDSFVWAADGTTAQAKLVCDKDASHIKYVDANMTSVFTDATCEDDAYTVYTASYDGRTEDNTVTDEGTATGHEYAFDSFIWAADGTTAQVKLICSHDGTHVTYEDAQMSFVHHDATCEADEYTVYTASRGGQSEDNTVTVENTATGHAYALTGWSWNENHTAATATFTCGNDPEHVETVTDDEIGIIPVSAQGCETDEVVKYKAVVTFEDVDYTEITDEIKLADRTGHAYSLTGWSWSDDHTAATATFTCGNDPAHVETVTDEEIDVETVSEQTCVAAQIETYTASVEFEGRTYTEKAENITVAEPTRIHTPVKTEAKAATCTEKGNIEYYTCSVCGLIFTEEACENLITAEDTVLDFDYTNHSTDETVTKNAKAATCTDDGYTGDVYCKACDHLISAGQTIPSAGAAHVFGAWTEKTAPGCTEDGEEARVCANCGATETRPIPALGHDWGEWTDDAQDTPSCTKDGKQNRVCARCGETETREITASEKGHTIRQPNEENEGYCADCGQYRCLFCEKDEKMHEVSDSSIMSFFVHVVHYFYHLFSNFRYTLSHR